MAHQFTATEGAKAIDQRVYALHKIAMGDYERTFAMLKATFENRQQLAAAMLRAKVGTQISEEFFETIQYFNNVITEAFVLRETKP